MPRNFKLSKNKKIPKISNAPIVSPFILNAFTYDKKTSKAFD